MIFLSSHKLFSDTLSEPSFGDGSFELTPTARGCKQDSGHCFPICRSPFSLSPSIDFKDLSRAAQSWPLHEKGQGHTLKTRGWCGLRLVDFVTRPSLTLTPKNYLENYLIQFGNINMCNAYSYKLSKSLNSTM